MTRLVINVTADLKPLLNVHRYAEKNKPIVLLTAAQRYLRFLQRRFISLSAGGGEWPELKQSTIERKERRGVSGNSEAILRESDELLQGLGLKFVHDTYHVGYVQNKQHWRARGTIFLARIHTKGLGIVPVRRVIGRPSNTVRRGMTTDIRREYQKIIRRARRARRAL